jgi:hypothetical protein
MRKAVSAVRILPAATVYTALGLTCALYLVFIGRQIPYLFSAFAGAPPGGFKIYSEYARSGFFDMCAIPAINLSVLTAANLISKKIAE